MELNSLQPASIWHYFGEILEIPRPSKKEEKIAAYLVDFAKKHNLEYEQDELLNIVIRKPGTRGKENVKSVILQSHIDMVCEKNQDTVHDFDKDPIQAYVEDGWVKAKGTTLGADCGIGIAAQLAILEASDVEHGPIECLFTIDEETGLTGAFGLKKDFLKSNILLNLDSEDEGELFIGCAGGKDTLAFIDFQNEELSEGYKSLQVIIKGLKGGHSGDDIHKGLGNANKLLNRFLWECHYDFNIRIGEIDSGNLRNAIAREGFATIAVADEHVEDVKEFAVRFAETITDELKVTEPNLEFDLIEIEDIKEVIDLETQINLLNALYACPHGVIAWSAEIPDFVETSTNLASVKMKDGKIEITTSQRSSVESAKDDICNMVASTFILAGANVKHSDGYPGWKPDPNSEIVDITVKSYNKLFKQEPIVRAIHAGLECGLIGDKYPGMDMISFGPTIKGAHSPDERLNIETTQKFWDLLIDVLNEIPEN